MRIHMESLIFEVTLNIALLVLVATLLSKLQVIQTTISQERRSFAGQVFLAAVFGAVIILSVYTGIEVGGYNMNTRVIAAIASGILGGPVVGMYASMIGAVYVYLHGSFRTAGRRVLPVFSKGEVEIPGSLLFGMFCGNL